jgi:regulator of protease activity HflC (stomatin/prohibitin superfamily)
MRQLRGPLALVVVTALLVTIMILMTIRFHTVAAGEVGITVNKITGEIEALDSGTHIINFTKDFHRLDKLEQKIDMMADMSRPNVEGDELRVKTVDGSSVRLNMTVQYIIDPAQVRRVIQTSGPESAYKEKWVRDYARSICRSVFGELTTEEFYDASKRGEKARKAKDELNARLDNPADPAKGFGIRVTSVNPQEFRFNTEYEQKILEKKLADQSVEEELSLARAATQMMERRRVEATKAKEVEIQTYAGGMRQLIVAAQAEAKKIHDEADAYAIRKRVGAEAQFYQMQQNAEATLATKEAEAEGVRQLAEALRGEGGLNIVKMEYVKRLSEMMISGQPFKIEGVTERLSHSEERPGDAGAFARRSPPPAIPPPGEEVPR